MEIQLFPSKTGILVYTKLYDKEVPIDLKG